MSPPEVDSPEAGRAAAGQRRDSLPRDSLPRDSLRRASPRRDVPSPGSLRGDFLHSLAAVDRRRRLQRVLRSLVWLAPAFSLWLLSAWLLSAAGGAYGFGEGSVAALWPSWAGGIILLALVLREAVSLFPDLPAAARAVDRAGDLHDTVATALEMQKQEMQGHLNGKRHLDGKRAGADTGGRNDLKQQAPDPYDTEPHDTEPHAPKQAAETVLPLPWIALVLERGVEGLNRIGPRQAVPRLVPRGAMASTVVSAVLLVPIVLPRSFVGEALAAVMSSEDAAASPRSFEAAALEEEPGRRPRVPALDVQLGDLPFLTLRLREPDASDEARRSGDASEGVEGSPGEGAETEGNSTNDGENGEGAAGDFADEGKAETGTDLMRELDTGEGDRAEDPGAPGTPGEGEGAEAGTETAAGEGAGGQPTEDGEGPGNESGSAAAASDEPGTSSAEPDGSAAGVGTGPQDEMVDPFGDLLTPAFSLEQALDTALLESREEIERRPLSTTGATRFRAAEVAMRGSGGTISGGGGSDATAAKGDLPPPRRPIAWRHRASVRRYLESLEDDSREDRE